MKLAAAVVLSFAALSAFAIEPFNKTKDGGVAIEGYDAVAYFADGKPVKGSDEFRHEWMNATWRFASAEHRDAFAKEPEKYAPQYGGYCAFGVSRGYAVPVDPEAWKVVDGKLYLNYNKDVQTEWNKDIPGYIRKADANWPEVLKK
jgi:YHS domain-containing protein